MSNYHIYDDKMSSSQKDRNTVMLKCAEELSELSCVLLQQLNKPKKKLDKKIASEYQDVMVQLKELSKVYGLK